VEEQHVATVQAPIKVSSTTKEKIQYVAALRAVSQARIVDEAIDEYVARHASELEAGLKRAHAALLKGPASLAAYVLEADAEAAERVSGTRSP
jgi:predicted transcriptional regulator